LFSSFHQHCSCQLLYTPSPTPAFSCEHQPPVSLSAHMPWKEGHHVSFHLFSQHKHACPLFHSQRHLSQ
jgi:hypothetical protein